MNKNEQLLADALRRWMLYAGPKCDSLGLDWRSKVDSVMLSPSDPLPPEGEKMPEDARKRTNATRKPMIDE